MRVEKLKGSRFFCAGLMLFTLMFAGCPIPDTGTVTEMQGENQEEADAMAALMTGTVKQVACGQDSSLKVCRSQAFTRWKCRTVGGTLRQGL
ncbi:MAG: hypothetical protein EHM28_11695 [Spirochaetaceae bacterium]|nr:MAG: hypothetical protein EHM28_11695 [Spirochaetaceae bacterium]